jgi:3-hydroxyacyl-[acyl-carrier-protein] dehydratase
MASQLTVQDYLPHRYPFLLVDKIIEIIPEQKIVAIKNVSANELFFQGHFPNQPIMPGVLIIEAMAQAASILANYHQRSNQKKYLLGSLDQVKFKHPVIPGDQLQLTACIQWRKLGVTKCKTTATVQDKLVCTASMSGVIFS